MQKFQAYLKMIISTFKEQPLLNSVSWEKPFQFYDI